MLFVCEHRIRGHAHFLRPLDLAVPVRALDQATHEAHLVLPRQRADVLDEFERAGLVGLQSESETAPLRTLGLHLFEQRFEHVKREFQTIHLFCIDGQVDLRGSGHFAKLPYARHQFVHHAGMLCVFVPGVQRGEFDGDAVRVFWAKCCRGCMRLREIFDCVLVAGKVAIGVLHRARTFAQHVEAETQITELFALRFRFR